MAKTTQYHVDPAKIQIGLTRLHDLFANTSPLPLANRRAPRENSGHGRDLLADIILRACRLLFYFSVSQLIN